MRDSQSGILAPVPRAARYLTFNLKGGAEPREALRTLARVADGEASVVGLGAPLLAALGKTIEGLRAFGHFSGAKVDTPATPAALWCWLRGDDRGEIVLRARKIERLLAPAFVVDSAIDAFRYGRGLDMTGYEDGTENPRGKKALDAAIVKGAGSGFDGASFVAVQQWVHDLDRFDAMARKDQDNAIGRRRSDNKELGGAPASAHVKRTAQENFSPEAFVLRRSMPWADATRAGLVFVAFGKSLDAFEAQLKRMTGAEDGTVDALFTFTRPVTGAYFWCPPVKRKGLDLRAIGL